MKFSPKVLCASYNRKNNNFKDLFNQNIQLKHYKRLLFIILNLTNIIVNYFFFIINIYGRFSRL